MRGDLGEIDDRLARGIAAADQRDVLALAQFRLERRRPIMDRHAFERVQIGHVETAIAGTAGDDDGAGTNRVAGAEAEPEIAIARFELHRLGGNRHLDAKFLRLGEGAAHQRHAGNAGRKAEIILDPGRCAGLAAKGAAVERQHRETLRAGIDRGRQPGRAGADHGDVEDMIGVDRADQADAAAERGFGRIAQQLAARAEHDRQLLGRDLEALDQGARAFVLVRVETGVRMAVAGEEALQPQHVGILGMADDHRPACADFESVPSA